MTTSPSPLPPGSCLTDRWPLLPHPQRRAWLRVVEREARAVEIEAGEARRLERIPGLDAATVNAALRPTPSPDTRRRQQELQQALDGYRVGQPRRTTTLRGA